MQKHKAVTVFFSSKQLLFFFSSKQLLLFVFVLQFCINHLLIWSSQGMVVGARGPRRWSVGQSNQCLMTADSCQGMCRRRRVGREGMSGDDIAIRRARKLIVWNRVMNSNVTGWKRHRPHATRAGSDFYKTVPAILRLNAVDSTLKAPTHRTVPDCLRRDDLVDFRRVGSCRQDWTFSVVLVARLSRRRWTLWCGMSCDAM